MITSTGTQAEHIMLTDSRLCSVPMCRRQKMHYSKQYGQRLPVLGIEISCRLALTELSRAQL
jgi:hypothetical protein